MSGAGHPFIKNEPIDDFGNLNSNGFGSVNNMGSFNQHSQQFGHYPNDMSMGDMSDLNMNGNLHASTFGGQQNMSSSFMGGNSAFNDDELADLNYDASAVSGQNGGFDLQQADLNNFGSMQGHSLNQQGQFNINDIYSQTPDGPGPIQSPFNQPFQYAQYMMQPHAQSPMQRPSHGMHSASYDMSSRLATLRAERQPSANSKSPMTPKTPTAMSHMMGKTPDASSHQPISGSFNRAHQKTPSGNWDTVNSVQSYMDSPLASPRSGPTHPPIHEVLGTSSTKKSEAGSAPASTLEAKRQKRRQSHNAVERRRRDNINERIQDLAKLVPAHRLDDDRIQKHLKSNNPFPPQLGSTSPPQASSLLAGGTGKRAHGSVSSAAGSSMPLMDEKDKGPAKGDVLNGAVSWTRDLMWILHRKMQQESILIEKIQEMGGEVPIQHREDEARMERELMDAIARNGVGNFGYSRGEGSGLWVPGVTDPAGNRLENAAGGQGAFGGGDFAMAGTGLQGGQQFWNNEGFQEGGLDDFKEEDEFDMQM